MRFILVFVLSIFCFTHFGQSLKDFGQIPESVGLGPVQTDSLLLQLNWSSIKNFCKQNAGFYAYERTNGMLKEFEYVKQGRVESFEIISFQDKVLEFYFDVPEDGRMSEYFIDKDVWIDYVDSALPELPDSLSIDRNEPIGVLRGYYWLLGVDAFDEYGWICEYSTVGRAPQKRRGVIELIKHKRVDLLKKLMFNSNPQIQLYAIDALIYMNGSSKVLNSQEWKFIYDFRDSGTEIVTCGNMGSYKVYGTPISELLSKKSIKQIPKNYASLKRIGYFK